MTPLDYEFEVCVLFRRANTTGRPAGAMRFAIGPCPSVVVAIDVDKVFRSKRFPVRAITIDKGFLRNERFSRARRGRIQGQPGEEERTRMNELLFRHAARLPPVARGCKDRMVHCVSHEPSGTQKQIAACQRDAVFRATSRWHARVSLVQH